MEPLLRVVFVGQHRVIWKRLLLYLVTLGISRRIWLYRINKEVDGHAALGINHTLNAVLLWLPIIGPTIVTYQTTKRLNEDLDSEAELPYGPTPALWLATWVPIVGNLFYIGWTQDRLNKYWAYERAHPERAGVDIDQDLHEDPEYVAELQRAHQRSYQAGSRFDKKKDLRRERWQRRKEHWFIVQEERKAAREMGASTPVLPWKRPARPALRHLEVTCGRCRHDFRVDRDPLSETVLLCPNCGLTEVMPSLRGDALAKQERVGVAAMAVDCPKCETRFHVTRDLHGPTRLVCPDCGHSATLPAPKKRAPRRGGSKKTQGDQGEGHTGQRAGEEAPSAAGRGEDTPRP